MYDEAGGCYHLIDAEAVRRCPLGSRVPGPSRHTLEYAAPEQRDGLWSDSSSDVFACGASVREAVNICLDVFGAALGRADRAAVEAAFRSRVEQLQRLMDGCIDPELRPEERPQAADILEQLRRTYTCAWAAAS